MNQIIESTSAKQQWEIEFEKQFGAFHVHSEGAGDASCIVCDMRSFVGASLQKLKTALRESLPKEPKVDINTYLPLVEKWDGKNYDVPFEEGYNQAVQEINTLLK